MCDFRFELVSTVKKTLKSLKKPLRFLRPQRKPRCSPFWPFWDPYNHPKNSTFFSSKKSWPTPTPRFLDPRVDFKRGTCHLFKTYLRIFLLKGSRSSRFFVSLRARLFFVICNILKIGGCFVPNSRTFSIGGDFWIRERILKDGSMRVEKQPSDPKISGWLGSNFFFDQKKWCKKHDFPVWTCFQQ